MMSRWMKRRAGRVLVCTVAVSGLVMLGCSLEDVSDGDLKVESGIARGTEERIHADLREVEENLDPATQARIELMTSDASESLMRAADFLAAQRTLRVAADITFDVRQNDGRLLEFGVRRAFVIRRPDRLRVDATEADGDERTTYFDGSTISIDLPGHRAFVRETIPGTYYAALAKLVEEFEEPVPLANLFSENFGVLLEDWIESGYYIGQEEIGGRRCEHLAFRLTEVDAQFWIEEGDRPLIARLVITYKHEEGNPQFRATLRDWELGPELPEALFRFEPSEGTERLTVGSLIAEGAVDGQASDRAEEVE